MKGKVTMTFEPCKGKEKFFSSALLGFANEDKNWEAHDIDCIIALVEIIEE